MHVQVLLPFRVHSWGPWLQPSPLSGCFFFFSGATMTIRVTCNWIWIVRIKKNNVSCFAFDDISLFGHLIRRIKTYLSLYAYWVLLFTRYPNMLKHHKNSVVPVGLCTLLHQVQPSLVYVSWLCGLSSKVKRCHSWFEITSRRWNQLLMYGLHTLSWGLKCLLVLLTRWVSQLGANFKQGAQPFAIWNQSSFMDNGNVAAETYLQSAVYFSNLADCQKSNSLYSPRLPHCPYSLGEIECKLGEK